jgi:uncharacterized protein YndB with AHSA1/START domain
MSNQLGKVTRDTDGFQVTFTRVLDYDIEIVWKAITDPQKLRLWFTDFEMDFRTGGKITIRFRDEEESESYGEIVAIDPPHKFAFTWEGELVAIDPPHKFAFTWEGELAVWELFSEGKGKCRLVLTYSKLSDESAVSAPAGFHTLLDRLENMLKGSTKTYPFGTEENDPQHLEMKSRYASEVYRDYPELRKLEPFILERTLNAPVEEVWRAITDKDQMKQWYFDLSEFKPEVGFEFQFYGQGSKGEKYLHLCKVTEAIPLKKLTYSWRYQGMDGISYVTFELAREGSKTILKLTHKGLHTFASDSPDFAKESFSAGWTELIGTLLPQFLERG